MKSLKENFKKAHILIIGSGIIGKFNALELSELGFQITIVDPAQHQNSSNAALGLLMGNMYQKRRGRSWDLRKQSIELWPQWITFLQKFNCELNIEKPLIQLTTDEEKFKKLEKFVYENNDQNLRILERDSIFIKNIIKAFQATNIKGMISFKDGRINPFSLLQTLDQYLKHKKVNYLREEIIKIRKSNWLMKGKISKKWFGIRSRPDGEPSPIMKNLEDGLIICSGFYKNGILLAPACSKWVANEIKNYFS